MAASTYLNQVQQLYIAYFGRPADPVGQLHWAQMIDSAGGDISAVVAGFSASNESAALYGHSSTAQLVSAIYQNVFGRAPEPAGLAYWTALVDSGQVSQTQAAWDIQQAAGPGDASVVNNKLIAANAFTSNLDTSAEIAGYSGANAAAVARAFLDTVDSTYQSIADVARTSEAAVAAATEGGTTVTPPVTPVEPTPLFSASVTNGVVTFSGEATGDISVSWSGTPGDSEAIFSRDGNAAKAITFSAADTISVELAATEVLTGSASTLAGFKVTGEGLVKMEDEASELNGKTLSVVTLGDDELTVTTSAQEATSLAGLTGFSKIHLAGSKDTITIADGEVVVDSTASATVQLGNGNQTFNGLGGDYTITGGNGNDTIAAGTGTHTLAGGAGNDTFTSVADSTTTITDLATGDVLNNTGGTVIAENVAGFKATSATLNEGTVTLNTALTASAIDLALATGSKGFIVIGGAGNDTITGSKNDDILTGGAGDDTLTGGDGQDTFVISGVTLATNGQDIITDFAPAADKIQFSLADVNAVVATKLLAGGLNADNFISGAGAVAATADQHFIYDTDTGVLSFDADGDGLEAAVALVTLTGNPTITATDIVLA